MVKTVRLDPQDPVDRDRWRGYLDARPDAHCADLPEWRLLYRDLYGLEDFSYAAVDEGRVSGVLLMTHIRSPLLGKMLVTCPFFGYGGVYWDDEASRDALLEQAEAIARKLRVDYIEIRSLQQLPAPFEANTDFSEFRLVLAADTDDTWQQKLSSNVRQNIRKSRKHELEFRLSTEYHACFGLLKRTLRAHGTPFHGERFFELLSRHLGDRTRYSEVWQGDRLVAAGVVVDYRDSIMNPYIGSLADSRASRSNYLQYWGLIEHYTARNVTRFEMGRSPRESTHARFKMKWGCDELPVFYNYLVINPRKGYQSVSRPTLVNRLAVQTWKRLPLALTSVLGPRLFRHIP